MLTYVLGLLIEVAIAVFPGTSINGYGTEVGQFRCGNSD